MKKIVGLTVSHSLVAAIGFMLGIYMLPILTAPSAPSFDVVTTAKKDSQFSGVFKRNLQDSDFLHWGDGTVFIGQETIVLEGSVSPGPDYKLYLSPEFVETEADFERLKSSMVQVGDVKTFENFVVAVSTNIDPAQYKAVIIWCESFGEFITAATYQ